MHYIAPYDLDQFGYKVLARTLLNSLNREALRGLIRKSHSELRYLLANYVMVSGTAGKDYHIGPYLVAENLCYMRNPDNLFSQIRPLISLLAALRYCAEEQKVQLPIDDIEDYQPGPHFTRQYPNEVIKWLKE